jgi:hypothetical protein
MSKFELLEYFVAEMDFAFAYQNDGLKHFINDVMKIILLMPHLMDHIKNVIVI